MYMYKYKYMYMRVYLHPAAEINLQNLAQKAEPSIWESEIIDKEEGVLNGTHHTS